MSTPSSTPIPAGWYPDPAGSFQQRWWTGQSWTNDFAQYRPTLVHAAPGAEAFRSPVVQSYPDSSAEYLSQQAAATVSAALGSSAQQVSLSPTQTLIREQPATVDPLPAFRLPDADLPPQTVVAQPNAGNATLIPVAPSHSNWQLNPAVSNEYQPFSTVASVRSGHRIAPDVRYTASSWLLVVLPIALGAAAFSFATLLPVLYTTFTQGLLVVAFLGASVGLAALDRYRLSREGHDSTVPPALALLTPLVFLSVRAVFVARETGRNAYAPLIVLLAVAAGITAALLFVDGLFTLLLTASALY